MNSLFEAILQRTIDIYFANLIGMVLRSLTKKIWWEVVLKDVIILSTFEIKIFLFSANFVHIISCMKIIELNFSFSSSDNKLSKVSNNSSFFNTSFSFSFSFWIILLLLLFLIYLF